jgi:hypothetical protein
LDDGMTVHINAAAYADDLILYPESREHMEIALNLLAAFRLYAKMKVNADECVSISQAWSGTRKNKADRDPDPFRIHTDAG